MYVCFLLDSLDSFTHRSIFLRHTFFLIHNCYFVQLPLSEENILNEKPCIFFVSLHFSLFKEAARPNLSEEEKMSISKGQNCYQSLGLVSLVQSDNPFYQSEASTVKHCLALFEFIWATTTFITHFISSWGRRNYTSLSCYCGYCCCCHYLLWTSPEMETGFVALFEEKGSIIKYIRSVST